MGFLSPRTIKITRPSVQAGIGALGYGGATPSAETIVATGVPAAIQFKGGARHPGSDLPADIDRRSMWVVIFNLPSGTVQDRDVITDDLGIRYQVAVAYWNSMGYQAIVERLEV